MPDWPPRKSMTFTLSVSGKPISLLRWIEATSTEVADNWRRGQVPINSMRGRDQDNGLDDAGLTIEEFKELL